MSTKPKPCDIPCPKCGSDNIHRHNRIKGEVFGVSMSDNFEMEPFCKPRDFASAYQWEHTVLRECITHHCRMCQYNWATDILPRRGKQ